MKTETILLIAGGLFLYSRWKPAGVPDFVGPIEPRHTDGPVFAPVIGRKTNPTPATTPAATMGTGLQMCVARDGNGFLWPSAQVGGCPFVDFVQDSVPYIIGADGTPMPLIY